MAKSDSNHLILHVDFAENWSVIMKDEIQSYHWKNEQVTIFTAVCYCGEDTFSFAMVSDDRSHDKAHALFAMNQIIKNVEGRYESRKIDKITIISDGAAGQFKNRYQINELRNMSKKEVKWIYSATGHGKGACDGVGGLVKHYATTHNLSGDHVHCIKNASDFAVQVKKYTSAINIILLSAKNLCEFREKKEKEWGTVKEIRGIQKCHVWKAIRGSDGCVDVFMQRTSNHPWIKVA